MKNLNYTKEVMKHFMNPKNMGKIENADAVGQSGNPQCGDIMRVYLKIEKNKKGKETIKDIKFQTMGCIAAIASTDALCDIAKGKTIEEAKRIKKQDIIKRLRNLPPVKIHCSVLGEETLRRAIENYEKKKNKKA